MAGFYIHIPFCRKVCYYCDFHFVATLKYKDEMLKALSSEIIQRSAEWNDVTFSTLYFGGGTPSVLSIDEINAITDLVFKYYKFDDSIEFTLEANPDDLTQHYLKSLKQKTAINRLSIGTQSFHDKDLTLMNRRHSGIEAFHSVSDAQQIGFSNLNIDLIYGVPGLSNENWKLNLQKFIELQIPHLSSYHLSFEPKTVFDYMRKKDKISPVAEKQSQEQYDILIQFLKKENYEHYEISNFALNGFYSKHNTSYWQGEPYIGIGPSAHSFQQNTRFWNIANNTEYCKSVLSQSNTHVVREEHSIETRLNEYILTSLRTFWGIDLELIQNEFMGEYVEQLLNTLSKFQEGEHYMKTGKGFKLTERAWLISDYIISEFFIIK